MGVPVEFKEANFVWKGWPAEPGRSGVADLPALRIDDYTISCWSMTWRERLAVLFKGVVWLSVIGKQPPVSVVGAKPYMAEPPVQDESASRWARTLGPGKTPTPSPPARVPDPGMRI